jgi:hypothetical protein
MALSYCRDKHTYRGLAAQFPNFRAIRDDYQVSPVEGIHPTPM